MKCAIYTRVSTDNQAEKEYNSCEAQRVLGRRFSKLSKPISLNLNLDNETNISYSYKTYLTV